jgi:hypothetical protein
MPGQAATHPLCPRRYMETVIYRIFYTMNRSGCGRVTLREFKRGDLTEAGAVHAAGGGLLGPGSWSSPALQRCMCMCMCMIDPWPGTPFHPDYSHAAF